MRRVSPPGVSVTNVGESHGACGRSPLCGSGDPDGWVPVGASPTIVTARARADGITVAVVVPRAVVTAPATLVP